VESLEEMLAAAEGGADIIMFDNMPPKKIAEGVRLLSEKGLRKGIILEASGGISLESIPDYAGCGVDVLSLGELTRNARWIDLSLEIAPQKDLIKLKEP